MSKGEHLLDRVTAAGTGKVRWICTCGAEGLPVSDIRAGSELVASGTDRARGAHEFHAMVADHRSEAGW
jgi:hypothetical protein